MGSDGLHIGCSMFLWAPSNNLNMANLKPWLMGNGRLQQSLTRTTIIKSPQMTKYPFSVSAALLFLLLNALIWSGFTILVTAGAHTALPESRAIQWIMAALAFVSACALVVLMVLLRKRVRIAYFLTLGLLALLAVLTITDEVGLVDWIYLVIVVAPLLLLIKDRSWYL